MVQYVQCENLKQRILDRVVKTETKHEKEEEVEEVVVDDEEDDEPCEPTVPAPTRSDMECQTDESFFTAPKPGDSSEKETPAPPEDSSEKEKSGEQEPKIQSDDTAPEQEPAKRLYYGQDITGHEDDSIFRRLQDCFPGGYHGEWAGFYNQGYPVSSKHRHMFWHVKYRKTMAPHKDYWYHITDDQLMVEYIARHMDQQPLEELEELKNIIEYGCSDLRMHPKHQDKSESASREAESRIDDDFQNLTRVLECYVEEHKVLPYCTVLHCLAARYLGGGLIDPTYNDEEYPYRISPQFTMMFWNLGNWCRKGFDKCPVPERLERFVPHISYDIDEQHEPLDNEKTRYNNYFINVIKNFGGHLFLNCEAGTIYPHRARLEEAMMTVCFKDYQDLMVAARVGKEGYVRQIAGYSEKENDTRVRQVSWAIFEVYWGKTKHRDTEEIIDLTRARMKMTRVCIYHVGQEYASKSAGIVGECIAIMAFECARYQVDVIAGDGNKAAYFTTSKSPGVPTYEHSLLQYWINKMMAVATQAQRKNFDSTSPPIRVKHFIPCSYRELDFLATHLEGITTATYTGELIKKTTDTGDCCMLSVVEWGHSREVYEEDLSQFEDEDHLNYTGEFNFKVNETCLNGDHNIFMVAPNDRDAHNPLVVHLTPSTMTWNERNSLKPKEMKIRRKEQRKEIQKANKRKGYEDRAEQERLQRNTGYGGSSSSSSWTWRPK